MSDLTYSWKFYVYNLLFDAKHEGDLKGDANQLTLDTNVRANMGSCEQTKEALT